MTPRDAPELVLVIPLEGKPRLHLMAECESDELRLRSWLERSGIWTELAEVLEWRAAA